MPTRLLRQALLISALSPFIAQTSAAPLRISIPIYSTGTIGYFNEVAAEFEKQHPETDVQIEEIRWPVVMKKLDSDLQAGEPPDLAIISTRWLSELVQRNAVAALDGYMDEAFKERFIDFYLSPSTLEGKTYSLPIAASARALYYNKDLFEQVGVTAPPGTWDNLRDISNAITALSDDIAGFGIQGQGIEVDVYFYYAFWAYGGQLIEEDGTSGLDTEAAYKAAELYMSMIESGAILPAVTTYSRPAFLDLFIKGKLGMVITTPILASMLKSAAPDLSYGVSAVPAGPDGIRRTLSVTDSIILFEESDNKDIAWEFLDLLFTTYWRERFTEVEGYLPVNKEVASMQAIAEDEVFKAFMALLPEARFIAAIPDWEEIAALTGDTLQRIYLGDAPIRESLDEAAARINKILDR